MADSSTSPVPVEASDSNYTISNLASPTLEKTLAGLDTELNDARADVLRKPVDAAVTLPPDVVAKFNAASQKYKVPVDTLMAMAQKDSGFNPFNKSTGPGAKTRGMINMSDAEASRLGGNPYDAATNIDHAAGKLRGFLDGGMSLEQALQAHHGGAPEDAAAYQADVTARTAPLADQYFPAPAPIAPVAAPTKNQPGIAEDMAREAGGGLVGGVGSTLQGAGEASQTLRHIAGIPEYRSMADSIGDMLSNWGSGIKSGVSDATKQAIADSSPGGDMFKPGTWTLGKSPSARGYAAIGLDLFGGMLPIIAASAATGVAGGLAVGGLQGGGSASEKARNTIAQMAATPSDPNDPNSKSQLEDNSTYYKDLIEQGKTPAQALNITSNAAARYAFVFNAPISAIGGAIVGKALHPAAGAIGEGLASRVATGMGIPALEMGVQNPAASMATNAGINEGAGVNTDVTEGTFGDLITGLVSGAVPGAMGAFRKPVPAPYNGARDPSAMGYVPPPPGSKSAAAMAAIGAQPGDRSAAAMQELGSGLQPGSRSADAMAALGVEPGSRSAAAMQQFAPGQDSARAMAALAARAQGEPPAAPGSASAAAMSDAFAPGQQSARVMAGLPAPQGELPIEPAPPAPAPVVPPARPWAQQNAGPLSGVLAKVDPHLAAVADLVGKRAVVTDELGQTAGVVTAHDADGLTVRGDDGEEQTIAHDDLGKPLDKGGARVAPQGSTLAEDHAAELAAIPPKPLTKDALDEMGLGGEDKLDAAPAPAKAKEPDGVTPPAPARPTIAARREDTMAHLPSSMDEPQLRARLKYIAEQGKANGWTGPLIAARKEVETAINRLPKKGEGETQKFAPESGTLGIPREEMPQVKSEHHGALVNFVKGKGVDHTTLEVPSHLLKPTQAEFSPEKVARAKEEGNGDRAVIVSNDGHIIDGHHQSLAAQEKGEPVKAIVIDAPVHEALEHVKSFPSAKVEKPTLPADLAGAKPGYAFGAKKFTLNFKDDVDKAAYIAAQKSPSKRDADYVKFAREATGMSEEEVRAHGATVREAIKKQARDARPGPLEIGKVERNGAGVNNPLDAAKSIIEEAKLATGDRNAEAIVRKKIRDMASSVEDGSSASFALDIAATRLGMGEGGKKGLDFKKPVEAAPLVDDAKRAAAAERAKDWYSRSKVAVQSFIENNGLGETHEVTKTNRGFEAKPKADLGTRQEPVAEQPVTKAEAPESHVSDGARSTDAKVAREKAILERIPGENGTEALVVKGTNGKFRAVLRDTDANESVGFGADRASMEKARADAQKMVKKPKEAAKADAAYGEGNKTFTKDAYEKARENFKNRHKGQFNSGIDPADLMDGIAMSGYHIEAGARKFGDYVKAMVADLGENVIPHLKSWYLATKFDHRSTHLEGLSGAGEVESADTAAIAKEATNGTDGPGDDPGNRKGVSSAKGEPEQPEQQRPSSENPEKLGDGQPADVGAVATSEDDGKAGVRGSTKNVGGKGPADKKRNAGDGREGDSGAGKSDAPTGVDESGPVEPHNVPPGRPSLGDFHIDNPLEIVGGTPVARFDKSKAAIDLFNTLRDEGRPATPAEQRVLAGYTGWGSFGQDLFQGTWDNPMPKPEWKSRSEWLRDHMTQAEWESAQRSITNAHYTDPPTVMAMWDMVRRMGFDGGRVLEPGMGIGNFFGMMPKDMKDRSSLAGIEMDHLTGGMAQMLYPKSNIKIMPYQDSKTPDNFHDVVIGNWPFENTTIADRRYNKLEPLLHDYYFLKTVDQTRPGGLIVGITSNGTMDKKGSGIRAELAKKAELVAAIRLPSGAFEKYAGTKVVTDIVILKKRPQALAMTPKDGWLNSVEVGTPSGEKVSINEYFRDHPENILGTTDFGSGTTKGRAGMIVHRPENMAERLRDAVKLVPEGVYEKDATAKNITYVTNHTSDREGALTTEGGALYVVRGEHLAPANEVLKYEVKDAKETAKREAQLNSLIDMRSKYGALIEAERGGADAEPARKALNDAYRAFTKDHGSLSDSFGLNYLDRIDDPFYPSLAALETGGRPATIMSRSTMRGKGKIENPSPQDAYVVARNESISPSLDEIAKAAGKPKEEVKAALIKSGAVFETPTGDVIPSDIYLSGNVREKLRQAEAAAEENPALQRNVDALKEVVPKDTPYFNIETQLGATWVTPEAYSDYVAHMLNLPSRDGIETSFRNGRWKIRLPDNANRRMEAATGFGTKYVHFSQLVNKAITNQLAKVFTEDENGNKVLDKTGTDEANAKIADMRDKFKDWLWSDPERQVALENEYNEAANSVATPKYDGSFMSLDGMALQLGKGPFNLREHQVNDIWRGVVNHKGMHFHEVGTGKTFTMAGIAMESRRYGIAKKPLTIAHNANSKAVADSYQAMYPAAKVLYIDNLSPDTIDTKLRSIANDDWDSIVIPHSLLDRMSFREDTLMKMAADQIRSLEEEAYAAAADDGVELTAAMLDDEDAIKRLRSPTAKDLVRGRNKIIENIKKQAQRSSREGAITFEDLGVDMALIDESHEFKKPPISTRMRIKGLNTQTSARSIQLQFITDYIRANNAGANVHLFTGTPITNTLTEIFHQMRYVMKEEMEAAGVADWDGWFGNFARETPDVELNAAGEYESVSRLASFINVPELRRLAGQYMDVVFSDDMPEMQPRETRSGKTLASTDLTEAERGELMNGRTENASNRPYKKVINVISDMTPKQKVEFAKIQQYARDWRDMGGKDRRQAMAEGAPESPIITEGLATKASFDVRSLNGERLHGMEGQAQDEPGSKISNVIKNVKEIYDSHPLASQVIFADQGFGTSVSRSMGRGIDGEKQTRTAKVFSPIKDLIERLHQAGIPREEIALVDGKTSKEKRDTIAKAVDAGKIRVVIGNTDTLGVGVNMQRNLRAMHHMDAPYMPGELEQRNGRGHRQGNQWNTVQEYRYMTDRLDGRRWQILARKEAFIKGFLKGTGDQRVLEGEAASDEQSDIMSSFSEAAGDPRVLIREKLKKNIERLNQSKRQYTRGIADAVKNGRRSAEELHELNGKIEAIRKDVSAVNSLAEKQKGDGFQAKLLGKSFDTRKSFNEAFFAYAEKNMRMGDDPKKIGEFRDAPINAYWRQIDEHPNLQVEVGGRSFSANTIDGVERALRGFQGVLDDAEKRQASLKSSVDRLKEVAKAPFMREKDLEESQKRLSDLEADLHANPVPPPSWLRQGAPTETPAFWHSKEFEVTGHRWTDENYYVVGKDAKGETNIPYDEVTDKFGTPLYDKREFEPPKVIEKPKTGETQPEDDGGKASIAETTPSDGMTAEALGDHLRRGADGPLIGKMIDSGKVVLHDDASTMPVSRALKDGLVVHGAATPDGKIHLAAQHMNPALARSTLLHEAFHAGAEALAGSRAWKSLMDRMDLAAKGAMRRYIEPGVSNPNEDFWDHVFLSVRRARTPDAHFNEELAAHAISRREEAPRGLREALDNFVGSVKDWALRKFGKQFGDVTPGQLRALAIAALHSWDEAPHVEQHGEVRYSIGEPAKEEKPGEKTLYGKATAKASDFLTSMMAGYKGEGSFNLLGAVPVRPLFKELARNMPDAGHYIDVKQAMDAMRHGLNERDSHLTDEWSKFARKNKAENQKLMDLQHETSLAEMEQGEPHLEQQHVDADTFRDLKARYDALSEPAKEIYNKVRDAYKERADAIENEVLASISRALDTITKKAERAHEDEIERIKSEGLTGKERDNAITAADYKLKFAQTRERRNRVARLKRLREQFESNRLRGDYVPLARHGKFLVTARDKSGNVVSFSKRESIAEQHKVADEMRALGHDVVESLAEKEVGRNGKVDAKFASEIDAILENAGAGNAVRDQVWQSYLDNLPDLSVRKNRMHRKGTAGYDTDALRAFAFNMFHGAHQLSRLRYGQDLESHLDEAGRQARAGTVRDQAVFNEMKLAHEFAMNPRQDALAQRLVSASFMWTMGWNLSTAAVVLHDPIQRGIPNIGYDKATGSVGVRRSAAAVAKAFRDVLIGKGNIENASTLTDNERLAMKAANDLGVVENTGAHDLAGIADSGADYNPTRNKIMKAASLPLHHAERVNRQVTFMAAYRIARETGMSHEAAIANAANLTWMSQFDTQASSKPRMMREGYGKVALALRNFHANILYRFFKDAHESMHGMDPEAKKAAFGRLISSTMITAGMAGIRGAYFYKIILPIAASVMGAAGLINKDDDPEELLRKTVLNATGDTTIGRAVGGMIMDGAPGYLMGMNLSDRIGVADFGIRPSNRELKPEDQWNYGVEQLGGPALQTLHSMWSGAHKIADGDIVRGLEGMLPAAFRNGLKAIDYARNGVTNAAGDQIVDKVAPQDVAKQALGFGPAEISDRYARNTFQTNAQKRILDERSAALRPAAKARNDHDASAASAAQERVKEFNAKHPEDKITAKSIKASAKSTKNRRDKKEFGVLLNDKLAPGIKEKTAPSIYSRQ